MPRKSKKKSVAASSTHHKQKHSHKKVAHSKAAPKIVSPKKVTPQKPASKLFARLYRYYAFAALAILVATTTLWSLMGGLLHQENADQLVDPYLFENANTFHNATFPGSHSFLVKWPIFLLIKLAGFSSLSFIVATIAISLVTVLSLAYLLYRIDKRPAVFGGMTLALASILLLVPPQPGAGALLPVNLAMVATRNLEYILYIGSIILLIQSTRAGSKRFNSKFWLAVGTLALVVASDRLFLYFSLGGGILALIGYLAVRNMVLVRQVLKWLLLSGLAAVASLLILWLIQASGLTHVVTHSSASAGSPFSLVDSARPLILGGIFAILGIATNFGANPAYDSGVLAAIPHTALDRLASFAGPGYIINLVLLGIGLYAAGAILLMSVRAHKQRTKKLRKEALAKLNLPVQLSIICLFSSLAAAAAYVISDHYYAADARYLSISMFSLVIAAATYLRSRQQPSAKFVLLLAGALVISIISGVFSVFNTYHTDKAVLAKYRERNGTIATAISQHPVDTLVGDYWRVLPIKQLSAQNQVVTPLADCTHPRDVLSSKSWQPDLHKHSFAYALSLDGGLTDFPQCSLDEVVAAFGRPNASQIIAGSQKHPKEILLFYDRGIRRTSAHALERFVPKPNKSAASVGPLTLTRIPHTGCSGKSIMNIVAHEDDDLLFMNPDVAQAIKRGECVYTVYLTAGDAGIGRLYWLSREQGSQAAYDYMEDKSDSIWDQRTVQLADHSFITVTNPLDNRNLSLIFFRLPDGNPSGTGFKDTHYESLAHLEDGSKPKIASVDGVSSYTSAELEASLSRLMQDFKPTEIHAMATYNANTLYPDHSDHLATGRFAKRAYERYANPSVPIKYYYGYPIHAMAANVGEPELQDKTAAFLAYIKHANDTGCNTAESCLHLSTYGAYLRRQYNYAFPTGP
jgi:LmbE family N-acetylglucosaminyl deacetylase